MKKTRGYLKLGLISTIVLLIVTTALSRNALSEHIYYVYGGQSFSTTEPNYWEKGYHPENYGYDLLGSSHITNTFYGAYPYYVITTYTGNTVPIDTVQGSNGAYFGTNIDGNTANWQNVGGPPDGNYAFVGTTNFGGFIVINASSFSLSSITVILPADTDGDDIFDDGDFSGTAGDNPCIGGNAADCDDNCITTVNPDQSDLDSDGIGDVCDSVIISGTVSYSGTQTGSIYVGLYTDPVIVPASRALQLNELTSPGSYEFRGIPDGTYYVAAVKTLNPIDVEKDDPFGMYEILNPGDSPAPVVISGGNPVAGVDFSLFDATAQHPNPFYSPWDLVAPMNAARDQFTCGVIDGKIYAFGGNGDPNGTNLKSTEVYVPVTDSWSFLADNEHNNGNGVEELTGAVVNGKFYVFGAYGGGIGDINFVEEYDPSTDTWTTKAPRPTNAHGAPAVEYNGEIYLFGGQHQVSGNKSYYDVVEAYNPVTNAWRTVTNMPRLTTNHAVAVVGDKAYVFGGYDPVNNIMINDVRAYDFLADQWITTGLEPLSTARGFVYSGAAPVIDGKIYLIGGGEGNATSFWIVDTVEIYDPLTNTWSSGDSLPQITDDFCSAVLGSSIYLLSGVIDNFNNTNEDRTNAVWKLDLYNFADYSPFTIGSWWDYQNVNNPGDSHRDKVFSSPSPACKGEDRNNCIIGFNDGTSMTYSAWVEDGTIEDFPDVSIGNFSDCDFIQVAQNDYMLLRIWDNLDPTLKSVYGVDDQSYNNIVLVTWYDSQFPSNSQNTIVESLCTPSPPLPDYGVTDIEWYAPGIGIVEFWGVDAQSGNLLNHYRLTNSHILPMSTNGLWKKYSGNPVFSPGGTGEWDNEIKGVSVLKDGSEPVDKYKMWYIGGVVPASGEGMSIGYATSTDGVNWVKYSGNPVMTHGSTWDANGIETISVIKDGSTYKMWYEGEDSAIDNSIGYATSSDGINWVRYGGNPVFSVSWDNDGTKEPSVIKDGSMYKMWYGSQSSDGGIGLATSTDGINWQKVGTDPVMSPSLPWENGDGVGPPKVIKNRFGYTMVYTADDLSGVNRIGLATSVDGISWIKRVRPILEPGTGLDWDSIGVGAGSLIEDDSTMKLWYLGLDSNDTMSVGLATPRVSIIEISKSIEYFRIPAEMYNIDVGFQGDNTILNAVVQSPNGQTWNLVDDGSNWFGTELSFPDEAALCSFASGDYIFTARNSDGTTITTAVLYEEPVGGDIPCITQEPLLTYPPDGAIDIPSPVTFEWDPVTDTNVLQIGLDWEPVTGSGLSGSVSIPDRFVTEYGPVDLSPDTDYEVTLSFNRAYWGNNLDGIPYVIDADSEQKYNFSTCPDIHDVDCDGIPDINDNCVNTPNADQADFDGDGVGDVCDNCVYTPNPGQEDTNPADDDNTALAGIQHYGIACDCDLDNNGEVGGNDFNILKAAWLSDPSSPNWNPDADFDQNGGVGGNDFNLFKAKWLSASPW